MILSRIELTHVGPFRETVSVGPFRPGLNLLVALNEAGKSTCLKAAARALFDKHTTKDGEIRSLIPAGSDLAPRMIVEFATCADTSSPSADAGGGRLERFRIEKNFWRSPRSLLLKWEDGVWKPIAEGDAADRRLQHLLKSTLPGRGATTPLHWGLLGFLWFRQGEPAHWPDLSAAEAGQEIRQRLARIEIDAAIEKVRDRLKNEADTLITSTGQARAGGPLHQAEQELTEIEKTLQRLEEVRAKLELQQRAFIQSTETVARLESTLTEKSSEQKALALRLQEVEALQRERDARKSELESAREKLHAVRQDLQIQEAHQKRGSELAGAIDELNAKVAGCRRSLQSAREDLERQQREQQQMETNAARQRIDLGRVHLLAKLARETAETERLAKLGADLKALEAKLRPLEQQRSSLPPVTREKLATIEQLQDAIRATKAELSAQGITVELIPDEDATVIVEGDSMEFLTAKARRVLQSPQMMILKLGGWGKINIRSGAKEPQELTELLRQQETELRKALNGLHVQSLKAARSALDRRNDLDHQITELTATLKAQLGERLSTGQLFEDVRASQQASASLQQATALKPEEQSLSAADLESRERLLQAAIQTAESERCVALQKLDELQVRERRAGQELAEAEKKVNELLGDLKAHQASMLDLSRRYPGGLDAVYRELEKNFAEATALSNAAEAKVPADCKSLATRREEAVQGMQKLSGELERARSDRDTARGALMTLGTEGIYSHETDLLERHAETGQRLAAHQTRAWAARIVHDLIERRKQTATNTVLEPLEERLSTLFADLTGDPKRRIFLDETLEPMGIGRNRDETYGFEQLSQGAKEQLLLCLRIAVAQELAASEPQVLILDDALVNTDPARQERILKLLKQSANYLQIVVLTCHADRWAALAGSEVNQISIQPIEGEA